MPKLKYPEWWRFMEFPMCQSWNLKMATKRDEKKLKERIENLLQIFPDFMPIEGNVFRAWLDVSSLSLQNSDQSLGAALKYLETAENYLQGIETDRDACIGYGIVIYAFFMWLYKEVTFKEDFKRTEQKLFKLFQEGFSGNRLRPGALAYVHATRGFALSRLGAEHRRQSLKLFEKALGRYPDAKHWLFCKARLQYRDCIAQRSVSYSYQKEPLSQPLKDKFILVKGTIERILEIDPKFHWAKAYLAHILLILDQDNTSYELLLDAALRNTRKSTDVALMACKIYKEQQKFVKCSQILKQLDEHLKTSEVYHQLGIVFYELWNRSKNKSQENSFNDALKNLRDAIERDSCNFPARVKYAELHARKAKTDPSYTDKALKLYLDVFSVGKDLPTNNYHGRRSATFDDVRHIFPKMQQVEHIYQCFLATIEEGRVSRCSEEDGQLVISRDFQSFVKRCLTKLSKISNAEGEYDYKNEHIQLRAKLYLADCERILGKFQEAVSIYETINREQLEETEKSDVNMGLAKCYCFLKRFDDARLVAESEMDTESKNDLLANISVSEGKQLQEKMQGKYQAVVDMGSLEGCVELIMGKGNLQDDFFSVQKRTAQTLAQVKVCLNDKTRAAQTKFDLTKADMAQRLVELLETILLQPDGKVKLLNHQAFVDALKNLTNLRSSLLEFECALLSDESLSMCSTKDGSIHCAEGRCARKEGGLTNWERECRTKAKNVLHNVLGLLNQSIWCLQVAVMGEDHPQSRPKFPILSCISEDAQNKEGDSSSELQALLVSQFPNDTDAYIPPDVFLCLLKIQPKFDENNIWLQVLSHVVNETTDNDILPEQTYRVNPKDDKSQTMCTVHLARRGCQEVEKMVLTILQHCAEMMDMANYK